MAKKTKLPTTFEEVCEIKGYDSVKVLPDVSSMPEKFGKHLLAVSKLFIIADCLNEGWEPDWNNSNEYKYWPWFWMDEPGFRFHDSDYYVSSASATGGSRLCYRTRALSDHAGTTFLSIYKDLLVI